MMCIVGIPLLPSTGNAAGASAVSEGEGEVSGLVCIDVLTGWMDVSGVATGPSRDAVVAVFKRRRVYVWLLLSSIVSTPVSLTRMGSGYWPMSVMRLNWAPAHSSPSWMMSLSATVDRTGSDSA